MQKGRIKGSINPEEKKKRRKTCSLNRINFPQPSWGEERYLNIVELQLEGGGESRKTKGGSTKSAKKTKGLFIGNYPERGSLDISITSPPTKKGEEIRIIQTLPRARRKRSLTRRKVISLVGKNILRYSCRRLDDV